MGATGSVNVNQQHRFENLLTYLNSKLEHSEDCVSSELQTLVNLVHDSGVLSSVGVKRKCADLGILLEDGRRNVDQKIPSKVMIVMLSEHCTSQQCPSRALSVPL